jgi:hypothetical protein
MFFEMLLKKVEVMRLGLTVAPMTREDGIGSSRGRRGRWNSDL